jgi:hypothetical protein
MQIDFPTQFKPYLSEHCSEVGIRDRNTGIPFTGIPGYRTIFQYRDTGIANVLIPEITVLKFDVDFRSF